MFYNKKKTHESPEKKSPMNYVGVADAFHICEFELTNANDVEAT